MLQIDLKPSLNVGSKNKDELIDLSLGQTGGRTCRWTIIAAYLRLQKFEFQAAEIKLRRMLKGAQEFFISQTNSRKLHSIKFSEIFLILLVFRHAISVAL